MSTMTRPPAPDAFTIVSHSATEGWRRMVYLLFTGPHHGLRSWCVWGVIIVVALGIGLNVRLPAQGPVAVTFTVVVGLVVLYFSCRFQLLLLEGVLAGEPRVREPWSRTAQPGLGYMVAQLVPTLTMIAISVLVFLPLVPVIERIGNSPNPDPMQLLDLVARPLVRYTPLMLAIVFVKWFLNTFTLPYLWLRKQGIGGALRESLGLASGHFGATLLLLVAEFVAVCAAGVLIAVTFCCTCCVWLVPAGSLSLLAQATERIPALAIATVPLMLVVSVALGWVYATVTAPVTLFFRAWSLAFVAGLDPTLGSAPRAPEPEQPLADAGKPPATPPDASPPGSDEPLR